MRTCTPQLRAASTTSIRAFTNDGTRADTPSRGFPQTNHVGEADPHDGSVVYQTYRPDDRDDAANRTRGTPDDLSMSTDTLRMSQVLEPPTVPDAQTATTSAGKRLEQKSTAAANAKRKVCTLARAKWSAHCRVRFERWSDAHNRTPCCLPLSSAGSKRIKGRWTWQSRRFKARFAGTLHGG
jgi:hypothetical protein